MKFFLSRSLCYSLKLLKLLSNATLRMFTTSLMSHRTGKHWWSLWWSTNVWFIIFFWYSRRISQFKEGNFYVIVPKISLKTLLQLSQSFLLILFKLPIFIQALQWKQNSRFNQRHYQNPKVPD